MICIKSFDRLLQKYTHKNKVWKYNEKFERWHKGCIKLIGGMVVLNLKLFYITLRNYL